MHQENYNSIYLSATTVINKRMIRDTDFPSIHKNRGVVLCMRRIALILCLSLTLFPSAYPQTTTYTSKNNYTGNWEIPASWSPVWIAPQTNVSGYNITINGYISCNGPLIFSGNNDTLTVNDTLVVYGDITLGNNTYLKINNNGILIIRGNLNASNKTNIKSNAYIVVTGNYTKSGNSTEGSFLSSNLPTNIFVGGSIQSGLDTNLFPVFNCPGSSPYSSSHCSYGNMTDLLNDPIHSFFQSTCQLTTANAGMDQTGAAMCGLTATTLAGNTPTVGSGSWSIQSGTGGTISSTKSPTSTFSGTAGTSYVLRWTISNHPCADSYDEVTINFLPPPTKANAGADQKLNNAFFTQMDATLSSSETGGWLLLSGSGNINDIHSPVAVVSDLSTGQNTFLWTVMLGNCSSTDTVIIVVNNLFVPQVITPNGDGKNDSFVIKDIEKNGPAELVIFNRWGNDVYHSDNYTNDWNGRSNGGDELSNDTYFYVLKLADGKITKGFVVIKK